MARASSSKLLVVGQAPGRATGAAPFPPSSRSGRFLASLLDVAPDDLCRVVDLVNLLDAWPGPGGEGDGFPAPEARRAAVCMDVPHEVVVLAGKHVAVAFGVRARGERLRYLAWYGSARGALSGKLVAVIPHPSGVNRWWNVPGHRAEAAAFLKRAVQVAVAHRVARAAFLCAPKLEVLPGHY